jgi:Zeta toxin
VWKHGKQIENAASITIPKNLTARELLVARSAAKRVGRDPEAFVQEYLSRFGNEFNADNAAELLPEYSRSPERRTLYHDALHNVSGWIRDAAFRRALAEEPKERQVVFTAGGTGSGKSTAAARVARAGDIVYDTTLSNFDGSVATIEEALASERRVMVSYVYRDPVDAFRGVLQRAMDQGRGRTVPIASHVRTHRQAAETIVRLANHYDANPHVSFRFVHSTAEGFIDGTIDLARNASYTGVDERLHAILDEEERAGRVSGIVAQRSRGAVPRG